MAEKGKKQYNLCSVSNSVQLPVQIHVNSDSDFLSKLAKNQQNSDADESDISDLDCTKKLKNLANFAKTPEDILCYIQPFHMLTIASLAKNLGIIVNKQTLKSHIKTKCQFRMARKMKIAKKLGIRAV